MIPLAPPHHAELDGLSPDQRAAYLQLRSWASRPAGVLSMGGLAGTGKTFLTGRLAAAIERTRCTAYVAYTARAASVLRRNLPASTDEKPKAPPHVRRTARTETFYSFRNDRSSYCGTLHQLLYKPIFNDREEVTGWDRRSELDQVYDLVVVDEASMLDDDALADLQRHRLPILAVGDHGQLPPVCGTSTLMANPQVRLERIHRQAEGSPIIRLAHHVRSGGHLDRKLADDDNVVITADLASVLEDAFGSHRESADLLDTVVICWMNRTRTALNRRIRSLRIRAAEDLPCAGELVVNLRNWRSNGSSVLANGVRGIVHDDAVADEDEPWRVAFHASFEGECRARRVCAPLPQLGREGTLRRVEELAAYGIHVGRMSEVGQLVDFGYALTVHKSQGSGFDHVIVVTDMPRAHADWPRWMYTAITRARTKLTIVTTGSR